MAHSPCYEFPLLVPLSTYLAPSSCDRNRPPQSQVARKLTPFVPHCPLVPSPPNSQPFLGFPELNVHLIRATSQTLSPVYNTVLLCDSPILLFTLLQMSALDAPRDLFFRSCRSHIYEGDGLLVTAPPWPPRVLSPEVLHADGPSPGTPLLRFSICLVLHHLADSLPYSRHRRFHPAEGRDGQLEQGPPHGC